MLNSRLVLVAAGIGLIAASVAAQPTPEKTVRLGRHLAHASRIMARFAEPQAAASLSTLATLKAEGLEVTRRYSLVSGGVLIEMASRAGLKSTVEDDPEARAERLLSMIVKLQDSGIFAYVGPDYLESAALTAPDDAAYVDGRLWGLLNVGQSGGVVGADVITDPDGSNTNAWDLTTGSEEVIVAVIDSGIRYTHADLRGQMWTNPGEVPNNGVDDDRNGYIDDYFGINALSGSGDPWDNGDHAHGTLIAGVIGAEADNGFPNVGVAWQVQLMALKYAEDLQGFDSDAVECIEYAVRNGARVINASWGGGAFNEILRDAIIAAGTNEVLFVTSSGNESSDNDSLPVFPSSYEADNIVSVTAVDRRDSLAPFSNYGRESVDIGAPGVGIFSTFNRTDTDYATTSGTSFAAPYVSGVAALILAYTDSQPGVLEVRERILQSAVPIPALRDVTVTGGRVNAYRALLATADGNLEVAVTPPNTSSVLLSTNLAIYARVTDLFSVTNALVEGVISGSEDPIVFNNDGTPPDEVAGDDIYSAVVDLTVYAAPPLPSPFNWTLTAISTNDFPEPGTVATNKTDLTYFIVGPPANDNFADAAKVPAPGAFGPGIILATNKFATTEPFEPRHGGVSTVANTVWWNWSPGEDTTAIVDTAGSSFTTVVAVYSGDDLRQLTELGSAVASTTKNGTNVTFEASQGLTYRIVVGGTETNEFGSLRLRVEPNGAPDEVPPVTTITTPLDGQTVFEDTIDVKGASYDPRPNASGVLEIFLSVNGSVPRVVRGTTNWVSTASLNQGANSISISAADYAENVTPSRSITVYYEPLDSPNDVFGSARDPSSAFFLEGDSGQVSGSNAAATKEFGEPFHGGNEGGKSLWWSWKAPADGVLVIEMIGSDFDTLLGVYTGDVVNDLTRVAGNDDVVPGEEVVSRVEPGVFAGVTYRIAVDGFGGDSGVANMRYRFEESELVLLTVASSTGGSVAPGTGEFPVALGSSHELLAAPDRYYTFRSWEGSFSTIQNPVRFQADAHTEVRAVFRVLPFSDGFETGDFSALPWQPGGDKRWVVTNERAAFGTYSARSGAIGDGQSSSLKLTAEFWPRQGTFDFFTSTERNWDLLEFLVDGEPVASWSGENGWTGFRFDAPEGTHTLEWRYSKDSRDSVGEDAVFLDNVFLPIKVPASAGSAATLGIHEAVGDEFELIVTGQTDQVYVIERSVGLRSWSPFSTNVLFYGEVRIPLSQDTPYEFYRAVVPE